MVEVPQFHLSSSPQRESGTTNGIPEFTPLPQFHFWGSGDSKCTRCVASDAQMNEATAVHSAPVFLLKVAFPYRRGFLRTAVDGRISNFKTPSRPPLRRCFALNDPRTILVPPENVEHGAPSWFWWEVRFDLLLLPKITVAQIWGT